MGNAQSDGNAASNNGKVDTGNSGAVPDQSRLCPVSRAGSTSSVFASPNSRSASAKKMDPQLNCVPSSPAARITVNGHNTTPGTASPNLYRAPASARLPPLVYSPGSMFTPLLQSPSSGDTSSGDSSSRRRRVPRIAGSRLGLIPTVKFKPSKPLAGLPTRGSVRIPPPDRITPTSVLSVFSPSIKSEPIPSTGEVIAELKQKTEKRKREDVTIADGSNDPDISSNGAPPVSLSQTNCTESKRRKHDSGRQSERRLSTQSDSMLGEEFIHPGASPMSVSGSQSNLAVFRKRHSSMISPKQDGHLRTAIASSYSSSTRRSQSKKRFYQDRLDEPLYKKSINLNYIASSASRDSSRHGSPFPVDNDTDSDCGSRVSVTPLPSVKNSPRASPMLRRQPEDQDYPLAHPSSRRMVTPKLEASVYFPRHEEPISGFVATLEDRAYDDDLNDRRARRLLGTTAELPSNSTSQKGGAPSQPQVVMPIIKPSISFPEKSASTKTKGIAVKTSSTITSSKDTANSESKPSVLAETKTPKQPITASTLTDSATPLTGETVSVPSSSSGAPPAYPGTSATPTPTTTKSAATAAFSTNPTPVLSSQQTLSSASKPAPSASLTVGFGFGSASVPVMASAAANPANPANPPNMSTTSATAPPSSYAFSASTVSSTPQLTVTMGSSTQAPSLGGLLAFGMQSTPSNTSSAVAATASTTSKPVLAFGLSTQTTSAATSSSAAAPTSGGFSFGAIPSTNNLTVKSSTSSATSSIFGGAQANGGSGGAQANGATGAAPTLTFGQTQKTTSAPTAGLFSFGSTQSAASRTVTAATPAPALFDFGSTLAFGSDTATSTAPAAGLTFGGSHAAVSSSGPSSNPVFSFGSTTASAAVTSSFGPGAAPPIATPTFSFGQPSMTSSGPVAASTATPFGQQFTTPSVFGNTGKPAAPAAAVADGFSFGKTLGGTPFGAASANSSASSAPVFGQSANSLTTTTSSFFGSLVAASQPSASATTDMFGIASAPGPSPFGSSNPPAFGANSSTPTPVFGFGTSSTAAAPNTGVFGQTASAVSKPAFSFGSSSANPPAFGGAVATQSSSIFGTGTGSFGSLTAFGGPGQASGSGAAPAFDSSGSGTNTPVFGVPAVSGASSTPFGASSAAAPFGAAANQPKPTFSFGSSSVPTFGSSAPSVPQFGAGAQPPAGQGGAGMFSMGTSKVVSRRRTRK